MKKEFIIEVSNAWEEWKEEVANELVDRDTAIREGTEIIEACKDGSRLYINDESSKKVGDFLRAKSKVFKREYLETPIRAKVLMVYLAITGMLDMDMWRCELREVK